MKRTTKTKNKIKEVLMSYQEEHGLLTVDDVRVELTETPFLEQVVISSKVRKVELTFANNSSSTNLQTPLMGGYYGGRTAFEMVYYYALLSLAQTTAIESLNMPKSVKGAGCGWATHEPPIWVKAYFDANIKRCEGELVESETVKHYVVLERPQLLPLYGLKNYYPLDVPMEFYDCLSQTNLLLHFRRKAGRLARMHLLKSPPFALLAYVHRLIIQANSFCMI